MTKTAYIAVRFYVICNSGITSSQADIVSSFRDGFRLDYRGHNRAKVMVLPSAWPRWPVGKNVAKILSPSPHPNHSDPSARWSPRPASYTHPARIPGGETLASSWYRSCCWGVVPCLLPCLWVEEHRQEVFGYLLFFFRGEGPVSLPLWSPLHPKSPVGRWESGLRRGGAGTLSGSLWQPGVFVLH